MKDSDEAERTTSAGTRQPKNVVELAGALVRSVSGTQILYMLAKVSESVCEATHSVKGPAADRKHWL